MNISLPSDLEQLVNDKVKSGTYQTASEVVCEGLRLLKERDEDLVQLRADIRAGFEAVERGEYEDYDEATIKELAERVKTRGQNWLLEEERKISTR
jgi:antitoxin ParD1/3/4